MFSVVPVTSSTFSGPRTRSGEHDLAAGAVDAHDSGGHAARADVEQQRQQVGCRAPGRGRAARRLGQDAVEQHAPARGDEDAPGPAHRRVGVGDGAVERASVGSSAPCSTRSARCPAQRSSSSRSAAALSCEASR